MESDALPFYADVTMTKKKAAEMEKKLKDRAEPGENITSVVRAKGALYLHNKAETYLSEGRRVRTAFNGSHVECLLSAKGVNPDGYPFANILSAGVKQGQKQTTAYVHHVTHWHKTGETLDGWHVNISHLCHHPDCILPEHLVREESWRNMRRQTCPGPVGCKCSEDGHPCLLPGSLYRV